MKCKACSGQAPAKQTCKSCLGEGYCVPKGRTLEFWALRHGWSPFHYTSRILSSRLFLGPEEEPEFFGIDDEAAYRPVMAQDYRLWWRAKQLRIKPEPNRPNVLVLREEFSR